MTRNIPEGMMPVAEFAKLKGIAAEKVVDMIRDGVYVGRKAGDDWFINKSELQDKKSKQNVVGSASGASQGNSDSQEVVVTDIQMPFGSMVTFMGNCGNSSIYHFVRIVRYFIYNIWRYFGRYRQFTVLIA